MTATRTHRATGARPLSTPKPEVYADVTTSTTPGYFHVRIIETAPGGEVLRQASHRLHAANAQTAGLAGLWLFNHSCRFESAGYFVWR